MTNFIPTEYAMSNNVGIRSLKKRNELYAMEVFNKTTKEEYPTFLERMRRNYLDGLISKSFFVRLEQVIKGETEQKKSVKIIRPV